jgi:serine phosphatase RsbU (regulator of sigma subunit)
MASISFQRDGQTIKLELADAPVDIGRDRKSAVHFPQSDVSRIHARITRDGSTWQLLDADSTGGTFVNGTQLLSGKPVVLKHRDIIRIGSNKLKFENEQDLLPDDQKQTVQGFDFIDDGDSSIEGSAETSGYGLVSVRPEDKLNGILRINQALAGNVDVRAICPRVLDTLFDIFRAADRGVILFLQDEGDSPVPVAQRHRNIDDRASVWISRAMLDSVLKENSAILSANTSTDPRMSGSDSIIGETIHSTMCAPMLGLNGKPFGIISLDSQNPKQRFSNEDLQLLVAVASQASHAFENARLLSTSIRENLKMEKRDEEMRISAEVQRALIPRVLPQPPGYQFYGSYDAAQAVGGDYFDCFEKPDGKICVSFGDVSGKGVPAALIMSRLSGIVRSTMNFTDDVGLAMSQINGLMCSNMAEGRYVTYLLGIIDPQTHTLTFANAGHLPPEIRSHDGHISGPGVDNSGFPVGLFGDSQFETLTIHLAPGTTVILRTDGVDDAMSVSREFYGIQRFRNLFRATSADPETIGRTLLADVKTFMAGSTQHDDITIMSFGRLP